MTDLFLNLVNVSLSAGILVLAVVLLRILLKNAPKWITCALWALVALRLIFPISMESAFSLIPEPVSSGSLVQGFSQDYVGDVQYYYESSPQYQEAVDAGITPVRPDNRQSYVVTDAADHLQPPVTRESAVVPVLTVIWLAGIGVMGICALVSYLRLRKRVSPALLLRDNIYLCDYIESPFILGLFRPRIYLPSGLDSCHWPHVIAHEQAHLSRRDHWWKPLGYALLCLHWFNPMLWLAYVLLCRDIELACDEKVIRQLGSGEKKSYSEALLDCSMPRYWVAACPLAFGEVGVKERVKTVLNYRKPAFWVVLLAVIALIVTAVCFLTDPLGTRRIVHGSYQYCNTLYEEPISDGSTLPVVPKGHIFILEDDNSLYLLSLDFLQVEGQMEPWELDKDELAGYLRSSQAWTTEKQDFSPGEALWLRMEDDTFYVWFQAEGKTYLGRGIEDYENRHTPQDATRITCLYRLEQTPGSIGEEFAWLEGTVTGIEDAYFYVETPNRVYKITRTVEGYTGPWVDASVVGQRVRVIYDRVAAQEDPSTAIEKVYDIRIMDGSSNYYLASAYREAIVPLRLPLGTDIFALEQSIPPLMLSNENSLEFTMTCDNRDLTGTIRIFDERTRQEITSEQLKPGQSYLVTAEYKALYCFRILVPHDLGIKLKARNATSTSLTIDCVQSGGTCPGSFTYGEAYTLEYYNSGKWIPVKTHTGAYQGVFPEVAYVLNRGQSASWYVNLETHYPPLAPGRYRYVIDFHGGMGLEYTTQSLYAEFVLGEQSFIATVEGILESVIMVAPAENTPEAASADYIAVRIPAGTESLRVGDTVRIVYGGEILEGDPAQIIDTVSIEVLWDLSHLPENYGLNLAILDGWVASVDGDVVANQQVWMDFVAQVEAGMPAQVRYLTYYTIGNPDRMSQELFQESRERYPVMTFFSLSYDGEGFTLRWFEGETEYVQNWKYLMHYEGTPESPSITYHAYDSYVLTDRNDVAYEQLWSGMVSADFRDQIPFHRVYTDRRYDGEPTLAELNKAMRELEPYMLSYGIASLDVNELTLRLDIQVREWKDGLFDLLAQFIDTNFVVVTELHGELAFTGTLAERYPQYFSLLTFKGLELYVLPDGGCILMEGTNRSKTEAEIAALPPSTIAEMEEILASYNIAPENILVDNRSDMTESELRRALGITPECRIWLELQECSATGAQVICHIENLGDGAVWTGCDYHLERKTGSGWVYYGYPSEELAWEDALQFHSSKHEPVISRNSISWEENWGRVAEAPLPPGTYRYCHSITVERDGRILSRMYYAEFTVS